MKQVRSYSEIKKDCSENIYYNVIINNPMVKNLNDISGNNTSMRAEFIENRVQSILDNPSDYFLSIIRFEIPGANIPLFVMPHIINPLNPLDVNFTPLQFTFTYNNVSFTRNLIYISNQPINVPISPTQFISDDNPYYYVYTYQHMIDMMNTTLLNCFNDLKIAFPLAPPSEAPYFIYNAETQLISLITQYNYSIPNSISIGFNQNMGRFLRGFNFILINGLPTFIIENTQNNAYAKPGGTIPLPSFPPDYLETKQEFNTLQYWNSFKNIVFITGTIPVQAEYIPQLNGQGSNNFRPILTDFEPLLSEAGDARSVIQYFPQGPYRLVNMQSCTPLNKFDVSIYWQDQENNLYPIFISPGQSLSIKFLFTRKI